MRAQYRTKEHVHLPCDLGLGWPVRLMDGEATTSRGERELLPTRTLLCQENSISGLFLLADCPIRSVNAFFYSFVVPSIEQPVPCTVPGLSGSLVLLQIWLGSWHAAFCVSDLCPLPVSATGVGVRAVRRLLEVGRKAAP